MRPVAATASLPHDLASAQLVSRVSRSPFAINGASIAVRDRQVYDISDSALGIDDNTFVVIRGASPDGWPA